MRTIFLWCTLAVSSLANAQTIVYKKTDAPGFASRSISKNEMKEDIAFWLKVMEESHVDLYHAISKDSLLKMENKLLEDVKDSLSQKQAVLIIGKLAAALNEGHIGLPSSASTDMTYANTLRFPFFIGRVKDSAWVVSYDVSAEHKVGAEAEIVAVNNIPVYLLNRQFSQYFGGLNAWRKQQIGTYVRKLFFLNNLVSPFTVDAVTADGRKISVVTEGFSRTQADSISKALNATQTQKKTYSFEMRSDNIAYINYRSMEDWKEEPFEAFLRSSFTKIREADARGLIIDLRENSGGNSYYGQLFADYFSGKKRRFAGGMKWKVSSHYKNFIKEKGDEDVAYASKPDGFMFTYQSKPKKPGNNPLRYKGNVVVLIGPGTFSSANMFADGIKSYHLATVMGEPTAESGNDYGEMFNFMLPNTHIIARASTKMFTRADGDERNFDSVIPDITVVGPSQKKDTVLETAVDWILKNKK
ncbi:S41 family peptidase [Sediminibacterium roseum]|uniref:S41 family peptidase n=1 Tax=Sediminibacterium roseum TaxID=1978412 RepID=A0ABX0A2Q6_9BACT|nr:S41 family peptidase [Sediminibacterium roseum]NCI51698.1 S41 family peptidase [Sediminibacterium roseum]